MKRHYLASPCPLTFVGLALVASLSFPNIAGAQSSPADRPPTTAPAADRSVPNTLTPDIAFAEGAYAEQMLRDPAAASPWYQRVKDDLHATLSDRQRATVRLARCQRLLNRPDKARALLKELLKEASLLADVRAEAALEMKRMPAVEPARLMPDDTLLYVELRDPGRMLREFTDLLSRAGLDELVRQRVIKLLRQAFPTDISKSLNRSVLADLGRIEGVALGLHHVGFETRDGQSVARADVLFVVYTGDIVATALAFPWVLAGVLKTDALLDGVQFYTPGSAAPDFHFAFEEGLLVVCSDMRAGADAVLRHLGRQRGRTLYAVPKFQQRPAGLNAGDAFTLYLDWPALVELAVRQAPESRREDVDIMADMLSLRQIGPIFGALNVENDRAELELATGVLSADALLYRLCYTEPLEPSWRRFVPRGAILGIACGLTPGDRRWRDFERLLYELRRVRRLAGVEGPVSQPAENDPLGGLRRFEEAAQLSIAEDVCRSVNGFGLVLLDAAGGPGSEDAIPSLVIILDVDQADAWRRRIERGLRRWLFGALSEAPLPTTAVETPVGTVEQLSLPRTRIGPAWQVQGQRVVLAFSVETLVSYLQQQARDRETPVGPLRGQTENKYIALRFDELLRLYYNAPPRPASALRPEPPPPLILRTYERDNRVSVIVEQDGLAEALRAAAEVELSRP